MFRFKTSTRKRKYTINPKIPKKKKNDMKPKNRACKGSIFNAESVFFFCWIHNEEDREKEPNLKRDDLQVVNICLSFLRLLSVVPPMSFFFLYSAKFFF